MCYTQIRTYKSNDKKKAQKTHKKNKKKYMFRKYKANLGYLIITMHLMHQVFQALAQRGQKSHQITIIATMTEIMKQQRKIHTKKGQ